jgi:hypothetical protein
MERGAVLIPRRKGTSMRSTLSIFGVFVSFLGAACATPRPGDSPTSASRKPAAVQTERGLSQVNAGDVSAQDDPSFPSYTRAKKSAFARADDTVRFYYLTQADSMNPKNRDHLVRHAVRGSDRDECRIASAVSDFKVITNPADRLAVVYLQGDVIYGAYKSANPSYEYSSRCSAGPVETDFLHNYVTKNSAGKYNYWTYLPTEEEIPGQAVSFFAIVANPTPNLLISTGSGSSFISGRADTLELNPCFGIKGKPYRSFVAFFRHGKTGKIGWINPSDPGETHKNESPKSFPNILSFMQENGLSKDGRRCL